MNKTCSKEKKRPGFKGKPKKQEKEVYKVPEVHVLDDITYILIGKPGFETAYAVDEKGVIDYALTGVLRKKLENLNLSEKPNI